MKSFQGITVFCLLYAVLNTVALAESKKLIPYEIIKREEMGSIKVLLSIRVKLVNGRLPTKEELGAISQYLYSKERRRHERTFVFFSLPGMVLGTGAFATAHHTPKMVVQIYESSIPDKYLGGRELPVPVYDSIAEMIEDFGDFSASNGTFKVLKSKKVPHIQLSPMVVPGDLHKVIVEEVKREALYGIYKTFIHTEIDRVRISVVPLLLEDIKKGKKRYLKNYSVTMEVTKDKATKVARDLLKIDSLRDAIDLKKSGEKVSAGWSSTFLKACYNDLGPPGLNQFYRSITRAATSHKSEARDL